MVVIDFLIVRGDSNFHSLTVIYELFTVIFDTFSKQ